MAQLNTEHLSLVIDQVSKDKNIDRSLVIEAVEQAILAIARRNIGSGYDLEAHYTEETGEIEVFMFKEVAEEVKNDKTEITLEDAIEYDADSHIGDSLGLKVEKNIYGRIEAQVAKQIIFQKIKEVEHKNIFDEFNLRKGEIVNGLVRKVEKSMIIVDLGKTEAVLPKQDQIFSEVYKSHDRIRAVLSDIKMEKGGPKLILSRASDEFLIKLFESEIPEIYDGIVKIVKVARAPGFRSKVAVYSNSRDVDPIGACVGIKGFRIQNIINELRGEKIDIIEYSDNPAKLASNALSPAEPSKVSLNSQAKVITVIVPDDQLSLAIGRQGQNVRLTSKLTDYKIDVVSESKSAKKDIEGYKMLMDIPGMGDIIARSLYQSGYSTAEIIAGADSEKLANDLSVDIKKADKIIQSAQDLLNRLQSDLELKERINREIN
ncbi:MAG: transcription termination/antitermination protein NusA [Candidatus Acididesulfobacter guangdongensis]|uniref:Transcription termination/antitermination protein NusA n=1 Tax=Acididesulfobacter guangdongensis TaxID=2597225 RepID=A0A519BEC6_ACIG2|nr:MAG: transcription termination/antitermination protein NusA [Candidatus Acididesulfobacter guangdongensis]